MKLGLFDMTLHVLRLKLKWLSTYDRLLFYSCKEFISLYRDVAKISAT